MKCPIDKTEMEKGILADKGYISYGKLAWGSEISFLNQIVEDKKEVSAYRCPKCGKVELTTETK